MFPIQILKDGCTQSCVTSFINNYRKIVRDQTFVDQTDNLYHLNLPKTQDLKVRKALMT